MTACAPKAPSRYAEVQKETTQRGAPAAVAKKAEQGATFNKFFPNSANGYNVVPSQEKKGFAEYKVNKDGKTIAMLAINDTTSNPAAAEKYRNSTLDIAGYPAIEQGSTTTGLLVNDRYQVKVLSRDPTFSKEDRIAWLQKFDLKGLAQLKPAPASTTSSSQKTSAAPTAPQTNFPHLSPQPSEQAQAPVPGQVPGLSPQPAT
jgi:hypothetical protein